jgi:hypothetical protein
MSKYEYVSDEYAQQLTELAHDLVTPERFNPRHAFGEIILVHMTGAELLAALQGSREVEGCPPDEAYPACRPNCSDCAPVNEPRE